MSGHPWPAAPIAACAFPIAVTAGAIQIFPAGEFNVPRGAMMGKGPWLLDEAHASALISLIAQRSTPLVIDYEHQSLLTRDNGRPAPAAGWIKPNALEWRVDGLYAAGVEWTESAQAMIQSGEYRFLSPVFIYDPDGYPTDLINVALTNNPAIDGMQPVMLAAASSLIATQPQESPMDDLFERLCYLLNLPLTTTPDEMSAQLDKLKGLLANAPAEAAASGLFGLLSAKDGEIAALKAAAPDPAQFVPVAALKSMQTELAALKAKDLDRDIADLIDPALTDGRLLPAQEQWARDLGKTNLAALKGYLETAQPIAALRGTQTGGRAPAGGGQDGLSDEDVAVCKQLGLSHEEFLKHRA